MKYIKKIILFIISRLFSDESSKYIYYHDIHTSEQYTDMSTSLFLLKKHIEIAVGLGFEFVSTISSEQKQLVICFDDGYRGLYENFDFFIQNNIPVTLFVVTDFIGEPSFISKCELDEMLASGLLTIESHTCSHDNLNGRTPNELESEIKSSKNELEILFNRPINSLCFPRGVYSNLVIEISQKVGYREVFSSIPGEAVLTDFVKKRNLVQHSEPSEFKSILKGGMKYFSPRYKRLHKK